MSDVVLSAVIGLFSAIVVAIINRLPPLQPRPSFWSTVAIGVATTALVAALLPIFRGDTGDSGKQLLRLGDVQVCWGSANQGNVTTPLVDRSVSITYPKECKFLSPPQLAATVHVSADSQGTTWAAYDSAVSSEGAKIALRGVNQGLDRSDDGFREGAVRVDYVAVGRWK